MLANLVGGERVHIRRAFSDQALGKLIELLVVIGRIVLAAGPVEPEPVDVFLDRVDVLDVLFDRVGVVETKIAVAPELAAIPKSRLMALACPMCRYPLGSGGNRVTTRPVFPAATSAATISRMKS